MSLSCLRMQQHFPKRQLQIPLTGSVQEFVLWQRDVQCKAMRCLVPAAPYLLMMCSWKVACLVDR